MPVLAAPPPTRTALRPRTAPARSAAQALNLSPVAFFGRTLAEYTQCFALNTDALRRRDVLDVGAGPSSFAAEACARRINAVAIDPVYGGPSTEVSGRIEADYTRMLGEMQAHAGLFRLKPFSSLQDAEIDRRLAAQRFLVDYSVHFAHGRYVRGGLPHLPFFDRTFDLVLCADLLFLHSATFDYAWHLAACRELVRVTADEVRIHPLCGPDGRPYPKLPALRRELREGGIESAVIATEYEFLAGSNSMLVLKRGVP